MKNWTHIIIHHSAGSDSSTGMSYDDIVKHHIHVNGWKDIGYHFVVERIEGKVVVLVGRGLDQSGAHASRWNSKAIGICFVGNYENTVPDNATIQTAVDRIIRPLCKTFHIPRANIIGHRDTKATLCPGENLYKLIPNIRNMI